VTAAIGATVLLTLVLAGDIYGTALLAAVLALAMMHEYVDMTISLPDLEEKRWLLLAATWLIAFANFWMPNAEYALLLLSFLGVFSYFLFTAARHRGEAFALHFRELVFAMFGVIYLAFLPLFLVSLRAQKDGAHWIMVFLLIVWAGDTGAYFAGKRFGKRKLYPEISPKKTLEGGAGGLAAGLVATLLYKLLFFRSMGWLAVALIPLVVGTAAAIGDLCESFLKRAFDRKDSGTLLPGHGGFLDRFDGIVFSLPVMYACIRLLG
jgi:phosphatidate cytidylyltransferase